MFKALVRISETTELIHSGFFSVIVQSIYHFSLIAFVFLKVTSHFECIRVFYCMLLVASERQISVCQKQKRNEQRSRFWAKQRAKVASANLYLQRFWGSAFHINCVLLLKALFIYLFIQSDFGPNSKPPSSAVNHSVTSDSAAHTSLHEIPCHPEKSPPTLTDSCGMKNFLGSFFFLCMHTLSRSKPSCFLSVTVGKTLLLT